MGKRPRRSKDFDHAAAAIAGAPLPSVLLCAWRDQLALHGTAEACWLDSDQLQSGTLVGETIMAIPELAVYAEHIAGVEIWGQRRMLSSPMHLHFDCDEQYSRLSQKLRCPSHTCVLYASDFGGPTLVLDFRPGDAWHETVRCFACWPSAGQSFSFPGNMLHAVLATEPAKSVCSGGGDGGEDGDGNSSGDDGSDGVGSIVRETVVLNLWSERPVDLPGVLHSDIPTVDIPITNASWLASSITIAGDSLTEQKQQEQQHGEEQDEEQKDAPLEDGVLQDPLAVTSDEAWAWQTLSVGTIYGMETVKLRLPSSISKNAPGACRARHGGQLFAFTALVRDPPDTKTIGPMYN